MLMKPGPADSSAAIVAVRSPSVTSGIRPSITALVRLISMKRFPTFPISAVVPLHVAVSPPATCIGPTRFCVASKLLLLGSAVLSTTPSKTCDKKLLDIWKSPPTAFSSFAVSMLVHVTTPNAESVEILFHRLSRMFQRWSVSYLSGRHMLSLYRRQLGTWLAKLLCM
jgi:hypothetical protein